MLALGHRRGVAARRPIARRHPARGHHTGTLAQSLAGRAAGGEDPWRAGIVHRLDRDTSGLLVVAKSDAVHRALIAPKPDPYALSAAARARFGRETFGVGVRAVLNRLNEAAA